LIVLVTIDGENWMIPGGHPNTDEPLENTLKREVNEEACATVTDFVYLGAAEVDNPGNPQGLTRNYSARFWAHVKLDEFRQEYETVARKMVEPSEINLNLNWHSHRVLDAILEAAKECEQKYNMNKQK
jgi:ADP-ribose pyrophosphatase YjhB (NUDIX family)